MSEGEMKLSYCVLVSFFFLLPFPFSLFLSFLSISLFSPSLKFTYLSPTSKQFPEKKNKQKYYHFLSLYE